VKIRPADIEKDALSIIDGAHNFIERAGLHALFPENEDDFISAFGRVLSLEGMMILLAEHEDKIVGGICILFAPYMWNPARLVGDEVFWWAHENAPPLTGTKLFNEAMKIIEDKNAIPVFKKLETNPKGVEKLYLSNGLVQSETTFMRF